MSNSKILLALLGGAAVGVAVALILSSEKGGNIKEGIVNKAKEFADKVLSKAEEMLDDAEKSSAESR